MVGIADLPVEIITGLKTSVQKSAADRAEKAKALPDTSSEPHLPPSKRSTLEFTNSTDSPSTLDTILPTDSASYDDIKVEVKEYEPSMLTSDKRAHTITIDGIHKPRHTHSFEQGDKHSHKAAVVAEKGVSHKIYTTHQFSQM